MEVKRRLDVLDRHLVKNRYLCGGDYINLELDNHLVAREPRIRKTGIRYAQVAERKVVSGICASVLSQISNNLADHSGECIGGCI